MYALLFLTVALFPEQPQLPRDQSQRLRKRS